MLFSPRDLLPETKTAIRLLQFTTKSNTTSFFLQEASNSQHSPALTSSLCKHYKWHVFYLITLSVSSEGSGAPEEQEKTSSQVGVNKTMMNSFIFWVKP